MTNVVGRRVRDFIRAGKNETVTRTHTCVCVCVSQRAINKTGSFSRPPCRQFTCSFRLRSRRVHETRSLSLHGRVGGGALVYTRTGQQKPVFLRCAVHGAAGPSSNSGGKKKKKKKVLFPLPATSSRHRDNVLYRALPLPSTAAPRYRRCGGGTPIIFYVVFLSE